LYVGNSPFLRARSKRALILLIPLLFVTFVTVSSFLLIRGYLRPAEFLVDSVAVIYTAVFTLVLVAFATARRKKEPTATRTAKALRFFVLSILAVNTGFWLVLTLWVISSQATELSSLYSGIGLSTTTFVLFIVLALALRPRGSAIVLDRTGTPPTSQGDSSC